MRVGGVGGRGRSHTVERGGCTFRATRSCAQTAALAFDGARDQVKTSQVYEPTPRAAVARTGRPGPHATADSVEEASGLGRLRRTLSCDPPLPPSRLQSKAQRRPQPLPTSTNPTRTQLTPRRPSKSATLISALSCLSLLRSARVPTTRLRQVTNYSSLLHPSTRTLLQPRFSSHLSSSASSSSSPSLPAYTSKNLPRAVRPSPSPSPSPANSTHPDEPMHLDSTASASAASSAKPNGGARHEIPHKVGDFELLTTGELEFAPISVSKWVSQKSGLKVVYADVESPLVQAYMPIVTEIFDDTGRPHTLEHLVSLTPSHHDPPIEPADIISSALSDLYGE